MQYPTPADVTTQVLECYRISGQEQANEAGEDDWVAILYFYFGNTSLWQSAFRNLAML